MFGQEIRFKTNINEGLLNDIYILKNNFVFKVNSSRIIEEIISFSTDSIAKEYFVNPNQNLIRYQEISIGGGTTLYLENYESINYYSNNKVGNNGKISSIDNLKLKYAEDKSYNRNSNTVGLLTQIDDIKIQYHIEAGRYSRDRGKIKSIGDLKFSYEIWSSYSEKAGYVGKLISVGNIKIKYYEAWNTNEGFIGKLKTIGNIEFTYYKNTVNNRNANIAGKYKTRIGNDKRIEIIDSLKKSSEKEIDNAIKNY
tara:strand:- start:561 stop:1322 length:762 start_codon:yes stop_codon:yes gene_type:complete